MKITVSKKEINEALKIVLKSCPAKALTPIYTGILLDASASCLELQSNGGIFSTISKIPANVEEDGRVVLFGKSFAAICSKLSGEVVTITHNAGESTAEISSDSAKFSVLVMNPDDFPAAKTFESEKNFFINAKIFSQLVKQTAFAAELKSDSRPIFTGINILFDNNVLTFAATDTHRLAVSKVELNLNENFTPLNVIVPAKVLADVANLIDDNSKVNLSFGDGKFFISFDNNLIITRNIAGAYPPFEKVFPKETITFAKVSVEQFKNVLERINVVAAESDYKTCRMIFEKSELDAPFEDAGLLKISATSNTVGKVEESFPIKLKGNSVDISFTVNNWLDALKVIDSLGVVIGLTESLKPVDVRQNVGKDFNTNDKFVFVATPVRTK